MTRVLITNDDGFLSPGLRLLCNAVNRIPGLEVNIVVPEKPQSAGSLAVTLHKPIRIWRTEIDGIEMCVISGRPCDAVIYAFSFLGDFDLVLSGVNMGDNTGLQALLASGTVCACIYASIARNIPGIAFSMYLKSCFNPNDRILTRIIEEVTRFVLDMRDRMDPIAVISVNFPSRIDRNTRARVCDIADVKFTHDVVRRVDPRGLEYFWIHGHLLLHPLEHLDTFSLYVDESIVISGINPRHISVLRRGHDPDKAMRILSNLCDHVNDVLRELFR
ncbi:MAG: stationary phase survival protein SurE [Crenarchaeota archaeon]|nr:stationary phase survival protein SurE [Thermoproteota archaeon]